MNAPMPDTSACVGIFNMWWSQNYGASLTALALQRQLDVMGYANRLIFAPQSRFTQRECEDTLFGDFAREQMQTTPYLRGMRDLRALNAQFDTFIVGSDQVWRYYYTSSSKLAYFCSFALPEKKLISMAASFGLSDWDWPESSRDALLAHIGRFDAISVREREAVDICQRRLRVEAQWVMDPVFFFDAAWWGELAARDCSALPDCYIASYVLDMQPEIRQSLMAQGRLPLVEIGKQQETTVYAWLRVVRDCDSLITDSYHGVCFALIFRKPFVVFANRDRGYSRFGSLLSLLGMESRVLSEETRDDLSSMLQEPLDEQSIASSLVPMIQRSEEFLRSALSAPCEKNRMTYATYVALHEQEKLRKLTDDTLKLARLKYRVLHSLSWGRRRAHYKEMLANIEQELSID